MNPKVSVIIICEKWNDFLEEALPHYKNLIAPAGGSFEVLVFSTEPIARPEFENIKFITSPETKNKPAEKRDLAIKYAQGEWLAFIDDDAFPDKNWLVASSKYFNDEKIVGIGGPGVTPESASISEKTSGWISASPVGGYGVDFRFVPSKKRFVDDYPSMNLIVRSGAFKEVGGFDSNYYPGEDTKLCLDLTSKTGKKIIYDPEVLVFHHKRPLFKKHLIQNGRYGLHRGYFARILPQTSRRWFYFIPAAFAFGILAGTFLILLNSVLNLWILSILISIFHRAVKLYLLILTINAIWIFIKSKNILIALLSIPGVFATHFWYGLKFLQGYFLIKKTNDVYGRVGG